MKFKIFAAMTVTGMMLCGCTSVQEKISDWTDSAQAKVDKLAAFTATDINAATTLASPSELNYAEAAQCFPVLSEWLVETKTAADRYKEVKGAAGAMVYKHWAKKTITAGFPQKVTLACSALGAAEKADFSDVVSGVRTLLGK